MTPVHLEYCPLPSLRYFRTLRREHPDNWSELTPHQMIIAIRSIRGEISDTELIGAMLGVS